MPVQRRIDGRSKLDRAVVRANNKDMLNDRQDAFKAFYRANGGNATQAAISAGYSPNGASVAGVRLVKRLGLQSAASVRAAEIVERAKLEESALVEELRRIAHFDIRKLYDSSGRLRDIHTLDDETASAIAAIDIDELTAGRGGKRTVVGRTSKVKIHDKLAAIDKAMRYLGMFERDNRQKENNLVINVGLVSAPTRKDDD